MMGKREWFFESLHIPRDACIIMRVEGAIIIYLINCIKHEWRA